MTTAARDRLATLLGEVTAPGAFSAQRTAPVDDLQLEVRGVGPLVLPVSDTQAEQLCKVGRPAPYGQGTQTLLDRQVRDTWEIPRSRVKIDNRRWNTVLRPILDLLATDLGLPSAGALDAKLHSMLVYAKGQFFAPHQDSEKTDAMVGSLVVTLPSSLRGGALVIEHGGKATTYRSSKKLLSFVAFYADCLHQIKPVTSGHRIVLTYNLLLRREAIAPAMTELAASDVDPGSLDALSSYLSEHFETPVFRAPHSADPSPTDPPNRLVYLLDHEYTARTSSWGRLKGTDAKRAMILREAATRSDCEIALALTDVHETWSCSEPDWGRPRYARWGQDRWDEDDEDEDEDDDEDESSSTDPDAYELDELVDWSITLDGWVESPGAATQPISLSVKDLEVCATTPSVDLQPYASEHEGYMGNYGNTMDRWYRRGALVLWPRQRAFAVRAEASPTWALDALSKQVRAGDIAGAQGMAATLTPFWSTAVGTAPGRGLLTKAIRVAHALDEPSVAVTLLRPFRLETLAASHAVPFAALVERYGEQWTDDLFAVWSSRGPAWRRATSKDRLLWIATLPRLCAALVTAGGAGTTAARLVLQEAWSWLRETIEQRSRIVAPSHRKEALEELGRPIAALLDAAAAIGSPDLRHEIVGFLCEGDDQLIACLLPALRSSETLSLAERQSAGFDVVARHCIGQLRARLADPLRSADDWSIELPSGCSCELCTVLVGFLGDAGRQSFEWPLAQGGRQHVHGRLDSAELPVHHQTRRTGRPYTLVLAKTKALFEQAKRARAADEASLVRLEKNWGAT